MIKVGFHVSISPSVDRAVDCALASQCDTFQIFSRNPRGWKIKKLPKLDIQKFREKMRTSSIYPPVCHMPYLPNLASPDCVGHKRSLETLIIELKRCHILRIPYLVTHLGSHLGAGKEIGIKQVLCSINEAFMKANNPVMLLLETSARTRNSVGGTFEEIRQIIDGVVSSERIGVCFDTCHTFAAGYDIGNEGMLEETLSQFDDTIGLNSLKIVHINDSKGALGSHIDRHEHIGLGYIGDVGFKTILKNKVIQKLPLILETPVDSRRNDIENMIKVRSLAK